MNECINTGDTVSLDTCIMNTLTHNLDLINFTKTPAESEIAYQYMYLANVKFIIDLNKIENHVLINKITSI